MWEKIAEIWKSVSAGQLLRKAGVLRPDLLTILQSADPSASLDERTRWLEELIAWVRTPINPTQERPKDLQIQSVRVRFLLVNLERNPELKSRLAQTISSILLDSDPLPLFSQLGLSRESSFVYEAADRLLRKILPVPSNENDLSELFIRIFRSENDAEWVENLDERTIADLQTLLFSDIQSQAAITGRFQSALRDALTLLSIQAAAIGLSADIRSRAGLRSVQDSFFMRLMRLASDGFKSDLPGRPEAFKRTLDGCRKEVRVALSDLDKYGVSVAIVYRLELLEQALERCERLVEALEAKEGQIQIWKGLLAELIYSRFESTRLSSLIADNLHLLARKIVERAGVSGEHYIARNKREYLVMLFSAGGGGIVTVGTTVLKTMISKAQMALFFEGFLSWINFAGSFLLMQGLHFTLATKQPSMTAPALAAKLRGLKSRSQALEFVEEVAKLTRSQFAAAVGNLGLVIPGAIAFDFLHWVIFDSHIMSAEYGEKILSSLNPFTSLTIPLAALTGVLLWLSSIAAGWIENWVVYRRIPEAIAQSRALSNIFGEAAGTNVSNWLTRNVSGVGGNVSLGFLLAFTPIFGRFFGLPLDVRHVTLSTGALTFAVCGIGMNRVDAGALSLAALGILLIGVLNFGVSFALALYTAIRARRIKGAWLQHLRSHLWAKLRVQPLDFFFPPREQRAAEGVDSSGL